MAQQASFPLRLPSELAAFVRAEAKNSHTSQNAVLVRAVTMLRHALSDRAQVTALTDEDIAQLRLISQRLNAPLRT